MTNTNVTTLVVARETKSNWTVQDNTGAVTGGFKNWVLALAFARPIAIDAKATIVRLSAKDNRVVEHIAPRAAVPAALRVKLTPADFRGVPTFEGQDVDPAGGDEYLTEESLNALPTPALVAVYNANGGNISGKFKGARKSLVAKILANVA